MLAAFWGRGSQAQDVTERLYPLGTDVPDPSSPRLFLPSWPFLFLYLKSAIMSLFSFIFFRKSFTCTVCHGLRFGDKRVHRTPCDFVYLGNFPVRKADGTRLYTNEEDRRPLHPSVSDWQRSARKGCHFCQ